MDVGGQCLLISFQPENHFRAPERIGPTKFHNITLATEISSQFDIKTLGVAIHTIKNLLYRLGSSLIQLKIEGCFSIFGPQRWFDHFDHFIIIQETVHMRNYMSCELPIYSFCPFFLSDFRELFLHSGNNPLLIIMITYSQSVSWLLALWWLCGEKIFLF